MCHSLTNICTHWHGLGTPPTHTHTSRPYKHMDVHQRVGLLSSRSGQQQVFHPKKRTYQGSLSPEQLDTSCLNTLTRWADSVSCCGGCLCSFSRSWTGSVNKVSALLCLSLREQPGRSHWRLRHQPRSQYKNWYVFCFFLHKNTSLSSAYRGLLQQIESHPYQKRWIFLPKMLMGGSTRCSPLTGSEAWKHNGCSTSPPQQTQEAGCEDCARKLQSLSKAQLYATFACCMYGTVICHCNLFSCLSSDAFYNVTTK